eukprot:CFRG4667T1
MLRMRNAFPKVSMYAQWRSSFTNVSMLQSHYRSSISHVYTRALCASHKIATANEDKVKQQSSIVVNRKKGRRLGVKDFRAELKMKLEDNSGTDGTAEDFIARAIFALKSRNNLVLGTEREKMNLAQDAMKIGRSMNVLSVRIYNSFLSMILKTQRMDFAIETLGTMLSEGIQPDLTTCNVLLDYCAGQGKFHYITKVLAIMETNDIMPDVFTLNSMLKFAVQIGHDQHFAYAMYHLFISEYDVQPDESTLNLLIRIQLLHGDFEGALKTTRVFREANYKYTATIYDQMFEALRDECKNTRDIQYLDRAEGLLNTLESENMMPTVKSYSCYIHACSYFNEKRRALRTFRHMRRRRIKIDEYALSSILEVACNCNDTEIGERMQVFMKARNMVPNLIIYTQLIRLYGTNGHVQKAIEILNEMSVNKVTPNSRTYHAILHSLYTREDVSSIHMIYLLAKRNDVVLHPLDCARVIEGLAKELPEEALRIHEESSHLFSMDYKPNLQAMNDLYRGCTTSVLRNRFRDILLNGSPNRTNLPLSLDKHVKCKVCGSKHKTAARRECSCCGGQYCLDCARSNMHTTEEKMVSSTGLPFAYQKFSCSTACVK